MGRQINIDLVFNANTQQAKSQMASLQNQLNQLQNTTIKSIATEGLTNDLSKASNAVISLKTNLSNAFNVDTGKLDLGKFSTNLKNSNMTLRDYRINLEQLGPAGQNAFNQLTQSIINGQMPLKQTKNLLTSMMNTFGSSIKWTIAYGAIDGIRQGFQDAFQYAQDLNESLTNIGVVAGKSADEMSKFAEKANKAAKALSATTVAYSDAALIYYQQGLNDEQVAERAATTMKLANVVGENASTVSEWMTAIWNNFDDGSKKLEYYADVMAKLGAETASSADEIADGFEKFAAVADTVGLSYERGAAAIATVTATTRQSADVVGTAFKTIFARIQDLELGNTLDDGTTLGQYSEALNKVGINIKTTSDDLREMDDILTDMGATWKTLSNDEQVALAKSVAGIRQYTQLIALMNNFDYFEQLTNSAESAEGTLEEQQERWAESWEASTNRVKAASEGIYSNLINDEFFINLNNIWADLLSGFDKLMDSMGGLKTILPVVLGFLLKAFGPTAISMVGSFATSLRGVSGEAQNTAMNMRKTALEESSKMALNEGGQASSIAADAYKKELNFITEIEKIQRNLNSKEVEELKILGEQVKARREYLVLLGKAADEAAKNVDTQEKELAMSKVDLQKDSTNAYSSHHSLSTLVNNANIPLDTQIDLKQQINQSADNIAKAGETQGRVNEYIDKEYKVNKSGKINKAGIRDITENLKADDVIMSQLDTGTQDLIRNFDGDINVLENIKQALKELNLEANAAREAEEALSRSFQDAGIENAEGAIKDFTSSQEKLATTNNKIASGERNLAKLRDESKEALETNEKAINQQNKEMDGAIDKAKEMQKVPLGNTLTAAAGAASMLAGGLSSIVGVSESVINMFETGEHTIGGWVSAISSVAMSIGMLIPGFTGLTSAISGTTLANSMAAFSSTALITALDGQNASTKLLTISKNKEQLAKLMGITVEQAEALIKAKNTGLTWAEAAAEVGITTAKGGSTAATIAQTIANWALNASMSPVLVVTLLIIAAFAILIGVIAGVVAIIGAISDAWNADAIAAEKANQKLAEAKELANEAKEAYDNLKKSIEDYYNTQKAIETMVEGTKEWKEAIREANQQVLELMTQYPELAKYVSNTNGRLQIQEKGFDEILNIQAEKLAKAQTLVNIRQITANNANAEDKQTQFARNNSGVSEVQLEQLQELYNNQDFETYNKNLQNLIGSDKELGNQINSLIKSQNDLIIANDNLQESIIQSLNQNNEEYNSSQYKGYIDYFAGRQLETDSKLYQEKEAEVEELFSWSNDDFWEAYLKEVLGDTNVDEGSTTGDNYRVKDLYGDYVTLQKRNAEGVFETVGEEEGLEEAKARQELVNIRVAEETKKLYGEYEKSAEKIETALKDAGIVQRANEAASTYQNRLSEIGMQFAEGKELDLSNLTWSEVEDLKNNISNINSVTNDFEQELSDQLNTAVEEYAKQRAERNLEASSEWLKNKEEREAEELSKILSEAEMDKTDFENYTKQFAAYGDQADDITKQVLKTSNAVFKLNEAFKNNDEMLAEGEGTAAYATAIGDIQIALKDWLGTDLDYEYVTKNLDKIKLAAEGDTKALKELQIEAARKIVVDMDISEEDSMKLTNFIDDISKKEIKFGASIDDTEFINTLNEMLKNGQITAEQASAYLNSIGYSPDIDYTTVEQSTEHKYKIKLPLIGTEVEGSYWTYEDLKIPVINEKGTTYTGPKTTTTPASVGSKESKSENKSRKRDLDNEIERYHEIDETIENTERELDKLSKAKDRAFGQSKLNLMDQEISKNKELLEQTKERLKQAQQWYDLDRENLLNNYAVELDDEGNIANYNKLIQEQIDKLKGMDKDSDAYEKTSAYLDQMKEDFSQYEETLDTLYDAQQAVIDKQNEIADQALEKITYKVDFRVEVNEQEQKYLDFLMSRYEDDAFAAVEKIGLQGQSANLILDSYEGTKLGIQEIMDEINRTGIITEDQRSQLYTFQEQLYDYESQLREIKTTVEESLTEAYDAWNEKLERNASKLEHNASIIEYYKNVVDIVGQDRLGISDEAINKMWDTQLDNANAAAAAAKDILEANEAQLARAKEARAQATTEEDIKYWDEQIEYAEDKVTEAAENFNSAWETSLQTAADKFSASMDQISKNFEKSIAGVYGTLDKLNEAFDREKEISERYLADYEKTYEISKLNRQIQNSIDKTDSVANQKQLRELQAELLEMSEEDAQVSEYQIGMMQKKYELMVAEQALRDAQNAKSVVRLRRDSEGNFGYVYTADQNAVDNAQQNYEDKLYELQKYSEDSLNTLQSNMLTTIDNFNQAQSNLVEALKNGDEQLIAEAQRNYDYYAEQLEFYTKQSNYFIEEGTKLNKTYNISMADSFSQTYLGRIRPDLESFDAFYDETTKAMSTATELTKNNIQTYSGDINTAFGNVGRKSGDLETEIDSSMDEIGQDILAVRDKSTELKDDMNTNLDLITNKVSSFQTQFAGSMKTVRDEISQTMSDISDMLEKYKDAKEEVESSDITVPPAETGKPTQTSTANTGNGGKPSNSNNFEFSKNQTVHSTNVSTGKIITGYSTANNDGVTGAKQTVITDGKILATKNIQGRNYYQVNTENGKLWVLESNLDKNSSNLPKINEVSSGNYNPGTATSGVLKNIGNGYIYKTKADNVYYIGDDVPRTAKEKENFQPNLDYYYSFKKSGYELPKKYWFTVKNTTYAGKDAPALTTGRSRIRIENDWYLKSASSDNWYLMKKNGNKWTTSGNEDTGLAPAYSLKKYYSFDTGGYTGKWGPGGRMAMLHQKELVLNAQDTENFLSAIKIVRSMADQLEANALVAKYGLSAYSALNIKPANDTLEQNVTIHAEFPNATQHGEIEQAFDNLINLAAQYTNRK